jgi:hypothetical protein
MPNTILKRWNGSTFEELYPKTTVSQISASGTANNTTFLRGDGQWSTAGNLNAQGTINTNTAPGSGQHLVITSSGDLIQQSSITLGAATTTFLRNDGQWVTPTGGGDVVGPSSSTTGRVATFNGTTGKLIQDGGVLLSSLSTTSHTHLTSIYSSSPQTVSSGGTLTLTLSQTISPGSHLRIIWGSNTSVYFRSDVFMMQFNGSDHFAVLEKTVDAVSSGDVIWKLSCRLGTTSTTGSYTGTSITFLNGMLQSMTGTQTASTLYVQQIFLITGA